MVRTFATFAATILLASAATPQTPPATASGKPAATANVDPDAIVPVEAFAELPRFESPRLSPDGTHIAAKMAIDGVQHLVVAPLFGGRPVATRIGRDIDINWWRWVGDGWLAVGTASNNPMPAKTST